MAESENYEQLISRLIPSAENGDAKSQYHLAVLYHDGKELPKDYVQAAYWYRKAAEQGHDKAQLYLGILCFKGYGVPKNNDEAVKWLTLSSEQGNEKAKIFLDDILNSDDDDDDDNSRSPSKMLMFVVSAAVTLFIAVILSAMFFIMRTDEMIASLPVKTLPSDEDDVFAPPVRSTYKPDIFSISVKHDIPESEEASPEPNEDAAIQDDSERNIRSGRQQVEKLLKAKKVSPFVKDTGTFEFNPDYEGGSVEILGSNVRMRKQPNTKSRIVKTVSRLSANESLKYLGEWTSPQGDKWVVCGYKESQKVRDVDAKVVWIFSEYARLIKSDEREL